MKDDRVNGAKRGSGTRMDSGNVFKTCLQRIAACKNVHALGMMKYDARRCWMSACIIHIQLLQWNADSGPNRKGQAIIAAGRTHDPRMALMLPARLLHQQMLQGKLQG